MCNDPAVSAHGKARHEVAVLALPGTIAFELGLPHRLLGSAVDGDGNPLYRVRVATLDGVVPFDLGTPTQILGTARDEHGTRHYDVQVCSPGGRGDGGRARAHGGTA